jgi:hypothetical protein
MVGLKDASIDELEEELERRKHNLPPTPIAQPNFGPLQKMIIESINESIRDKSEDEDFEHYVHEAAIEAVYGKGFWDWYNKQSWAR